MPGLSLLQDDAMMGDMMEGAGAAMDMSDMTAMGEQNTNVLIFWIKKYVNSGWGSRSDAPLDLLTRSSHWCSERNVV